MNSFRYPIDNSRINDRRGIVKRVDLQRDGLLWLVNRSVFHPRGYALGYDPDDGSFHLLGDGGEPWSFGGDGPDEAVYLEAVKRIMP